MRPLIPPRHYFDEEVFRAEQRTLFPRVWQLAGFAEELANPDDWVAADVGGRSVVVQNFGGELRAFANVCSHRFARIRCEARGNGRLRCPYHGWIYNEAGLPYSIPARPRFDDLKDRSALESLALRRYEVDTCGGLVFVREEPGGPTLREFLGESYDAVERMSRAFGERVYHNEMVFRSNWKVAIENTLEAYHVGFVHQDTFKKLGTSGMDFRFTGPHSAWMTAVESETEARMLKLTKLGKMPYPVKGYLHQLVFPNVTISTVCGTAFGVQILQPLSPAETRLTGIVFLSRLGADPNVNAMVTEMLGPSAAQFTLDVANEDRAVCEAVQLGAPETSQPGILSDEEERVHKFQEAYITYMSAEAPALLAHAPS